MVKPVDCKSTICESDISVQVWGNPPYKTECVGKWIFLARLERGACGFESRHSDQLEVRQSRRVAAVCKTVPYRIVSSNLTTSTKYNKKWRRNQLGIDFALKAKGSVKAMGIDTSLLFHKCRIKANWILQQDCKSCPIGVGSIPTSCTKISIKYYFNI